MQICFIYLYSVISRCSTGLLFFLLTHGVFAQDVIITTERVVWPSSPIIIPSSFGQLGFNRHVRLVNQSSRPLRISVQLPTHLPFIYIANPLGDYGTSTQFRLAPRTYTVLHLLVYAVRGTSTIFNDQIGLEIFPLDGGKLLESGKSTIDLTVYLHKSPVVYPKSTVPKPFAYQAVTMRGLPARLDTNDFPIRIYSNHIIMEKIGVGRLVHRCLNVWNVVAESTGMKRPFFALTEDIRTTDIQLDWTSNGELLEAEAMAQLTQVGGEIRLADIRIRPYGNNPPGQTLKALCQELCHLLGIGYSNVELDVMNGTALGHWHDLSEVRVTERDRQMLKWLYDQNHYVKIKK